LSFTAFTTSGGVVEITAGHVEVGLGQNVLASFTLVLRAARPADPAGPLAHRIDHTRGNPSHFMMPPKILIQNPLTLGSDVMP